MPPIWTLFVGICALWALYVFRPIMRASALDKSERTRLEEEKRGLLYAMRDAAADHAAGKLSDADHERVRDELERRAARVIAALDALPDTGSSVLSLEGALDNLRKQSASSEPAEVEPGRATVKVDDV